MSRLVEQVSLFPDCPEVVTAIMRGTKHEVLSVWCPIALPSFLFLMPIRKQPVKMTAIRIHLPHHVARRAVGLKEQHFAIGRPAQPVDIKIALQRDQFPLFSCTADN